jgi:Ni/Co efflux regulator RcnB
LLVYLLDGAYLEWEGNMNKKLFVPALIAAVLSSSIPAFAQDRDHRDDRNSYSQRDGRNDNRWQNDRRDDNRWQNDRRDSRRDGRGQEGGWGRGSSYNSGYDGWGPDHNMHRGDRLPSRYRNHQYVVNNWRSHHLSAPPRGHQWVQVGADYLLVAAATGLIVSAMQGQ